MRTQEQCSICATPLSPHEQRMGFLCGNPSCQWQYRTTPEDRRCKVCARPLAGPINAGPVCARAECWRTFHVDRVQAAKAARQHALEVQVGIWFVPALAAHVQANMQANETSIVPDATSYRITAIPTNTAIEYELPSTRRDIFRAHLAEVTDAAFAYREEVARNEAEPHLRSAIEPESPEMSAVVGAACGQCRGNCCRAGSNHAFVTSRTVFAYLADNPQQSAEEVIATYESYVPERTLDQGCVYQQEKGCALPRDLRSETCNWFFCDGLKDFMRDQAVAAPVRALFVQTARGEPVEGLLATASFVQLLRGAPATPTGLERA